MPMAVSVWLIAIIIFMAPGTPESPDMKFNSNVMVGLIPHWLERMKWSANSCTKSWSVVDAVMVHTNILVHPLKATPRKHHLKSYRLHHQVGLRKGDGSYEVQPDDIPLQMVLCWKRLVLKPSCACTTY